MGASKNFILRYIQPIIIIVLGFILFTKGCSNNGDSDNGIKIDTTKVAIDIPEKIGRFDTIVNPEPTIVKDTVFIKGKIRTVTKIDSTLYKQYRKVLDSIQRDSIFKEAIAIREYNETFEDSLVKLDIYSKVRGSLLEQSSDYIIKPQQIERLDITRTITKERKFSLYIGGGLSVPTEIDQEVGFQGNLGIQNKKGTIYELGYDTNGNILLGVKLRIFSLKK